MIGVFGFMDAYIIFAMLNDSLEMSKARPELRESGTTSFTEEVGQIEEIRRVRKYGNMKVLLETDSILITLGSDYACFICAWLSFLAAGVYLIVSVNSAFESTGFKLLNAFIVVLQLLSYLNVAVSNPGILLSNPIDITEEKEQVERFCKICNIRMPRRSHHCRDCDVCIADFDHHCPWTSKCIGGNNLKRFYFFVTITPLYLIYYFVVLLAAVAQINSQAGKL